MDFLAIAIIDSENKSIKEKVDEISHQSKLALKKINDGFSDKTSFYEIIDTYKNPPEYIQKESRLLEIFKDKFKKHLDKLIGKEFESYSVESFSSVEKLLKDFENKNYDKYPEAILTPNRDWIREGWNKNPKKEEKLSKEWNEKVSNILNKYKEKGVAVFVDCDS